MSRNPKAGARCLPSGVFERTIFASRWLLAPFYLGLAIGLGVLMIAFAQGTPALLTHALLADGNEVIVTLLSLTDLSLLAIFCGWSCSPDTNPRSPPSMSLRSSWMSRA